MFVDASAGKPHNDPPIRGGIGAILTQVQNGVTEQWVISPDSSGIQNHNIMQNYVVWWQDWSTL